VPVNARIFPFSNLGDTKSSKKVICSIYNKKKHLEPFHKLDVKSFHVKTAVGDGTRLVALQKDKKKIRNCAKNWGHFTIPYDRAIVQLVQYHVHNCNWRNC
jgi:hypothetical protein